MMNFRTRALFYRRLAVMLNAGLPLATALRNIRDAGGSDRTAQIAGFLYTGITGGRSLSDLMAQTGPREFTSLETRVVFAGEKSGRFEEVLTQLADYFDFLENTRSRLAAGLVYPVFLLHAAIIIPAVPALVLQGPGAFLARALPPLLIIYGLVFGLFAARRVSGPGSPLSSVWDGIVIRIPVFGTLSKTIAVIRFLRAFVCLYSAGVGVMETVEFSADTMGNSVMQVEMLKAIPALKAGKSFTEAFAGNPFIPPAVYEMLQTGELSGNLDDTLNRVAGYLQHEAEMTVQKIVTLLPVIVYLIVAVYIGSIVISFWTGYTGGIDSLLRE